MVDIRHGKTIRSKRMNKPTFPQPNLKSTDNQQDEMRSLLNELGVPAGPTTAPRGTWASPVLAVTLTAVGSLMMVIGVCWWLATANAPEQPSTPGELAYQQDSLLGESLPSQPADAPVTPHAAATTTTVPTVPAVSVRVPESTTPPAGEPTEITPPTEDKAGSTVAVVPEVAVTQPEKATQPELPAEAKPAQAPIVLKRIRHRDAAELREELAKYTELSLDPHQKRADIVELSRFAAKHQHKLTRPLPDLLKRKFPGLPFTEGPACQLGAESAKTLDVLSKKLNTFIAQASKPLPAEAGVGPIRNPKLVATIEKQIDVDLLRPLLLEGKEGLRQEWRRPEAIPTLEQMLQVKDDPIRRLYVEVVREIPGHRATEALARRAVFDLSADIRQEAVRALAERPTEEYAGILLTGLTYPWAPAAEHAAEAIATLKLTQLLPQLVALLDEPNPAAPRADDRGQSHIREVVKLNHVRNCALCHPISHDPGDMVRGLVPPQFGEAPSESSAVGGYGGGNSLSVFVRADITYLRQDFSVEQRVLTNNKAGQVRFDYLVRTRPATPAEVQTWRTKQADDYPQRQAVLFALRELTGQDAGDDARAWRERIAQR
jgi:hypothetical protein